MKNIGIYIHIPFCDKKCNYCDFLSFSNKSEFIENYFNALYREMEIRSHEISEYTIDSIFIGGGTPSLVHYTYISGILKNLSNFMNISRNAEISIEMNPNLVDEIKLNNYLQSGINRFSVGVQSFNDKHLSILGRIHNSKKAIETINLIKNLGIKNFNIDLMMALPEQSLDDLKKDVDTILGFNPPHISYYSLIIEENTPMFFYSKEDRYVFPDEDIDRSMYHYIVDTFNNNKIKQYEISNFAVNGHECKHNLKYWSLEDYLGFGIGSSSYFNEKRFKNTDSITKYIDSISNNIIPIENVIELSLKDKIEDYMIFGIRKTDGVSEIEFYNKFRINLLDYYKHQIDELISDKLMVKSDSRYMLTTKGMDLCNYCELKFLL